MTQREFVLARRPEWTEFARVVRLRARAFRAHAATFPEQFRRLTQDLNTAHAENYDHALIDEINGLVLEGHRKVYRSHGVRLRPAVRFITHDFPRAVRKHSSIILLFTLLFFGIGTLAGVAVARDPARFARWFSQSMANRFEQMYEDGVVRPDGVSSDADMFGFYIFNNVSIGFRTFAGGLLVGIGSLLIMLFNGWFLGSATAFVIGRGHAVAFLGFVSGHAALELIAIVFMAAAGFKLGYAVIHQPPRVSRRDHLRATARAVMPIVYGGAVMFVLAAAVEGFWSASAAEPLTKYIVGGVNALLVLFYFIFAGRAEQR